MLALDSWSTLALEPTFLLSSKVFSEVVGEEEDAVDVESLLGLKMWKRGLRLSRKRWLPLGESCLGTEV